jgi:TetR/AcrR family transcriptional regulator, repressor of fatR-cypB operon
MTQTPSAERHKKAEETAQRLLDAALGLFVEQGFAGTSVPQLGARAGVSTGLLYYHFANKEALGNALYQHWRLKLGESMLQDLPRERPYRAKFEELFTRLRRFATAHPDAFNFMELHHHSYLDQASLDAQRVAHAPLLDLLTQGVSLGLIKSHEPELLAATFLGAFTGAWRAHMQGWLVLDDARAAQIEQMTWEALRA